MAFIQSQDNWSCGAENLRSQLVIRVNSKMGAGFMNTMNELRKNILLR